VKSRSRRSERRQPRQHFEVCSARLHQSSPAYCRHSGGNRISQVKGNTLRDVIARLSKLLDMPVALADGVDPKVLDERFFWYVDFLGFHPSAADVLGSISRYMFTGEALEPSFANARIVLAPPAGK